MRPRAVALGSVALACAAASTARAQRLASSGAAASVADVHGAAEARSEVAPDVELTIEASTTRGPWRMRVRNGGTVPVRIVADGRLLSLDVQPRSVRAPVRCELPDDMRPAGDLERPLVLSPGASYSESFEPRLYCFSQGKIDALAPGAIVVAHLGWTSGPRHEPPFEVSRIDGVTPSIASLKVVDSPPIALPDEPSAWAGGGATNRPQTEEDGARLSLEGPASVDAETPPDVAIPVTLRNLGSRPVIVRFRPDALRFDLIGPSGVEACSWPVMPAAPTREVFSTLGPRAAEVLNVSLDAYCTGHGLDRPGLLVVRPRLDARRSSGESVGLHAFEGEVVAEVPTLVRLHRGAVPALRRPPPEPDR